MDDRSSMGRHPMKQAQPSPESDLATWATKAIGGVFEKLEATDPEAIGKVLDSIDPKYHDAIRTWAAKATGAAGCGTD
jgi:hypothetical protein